MANYAVDILGDHSQITQAHFQVFLTPYPFYVIINMSIVLFRSEKKNRFSPPPLPESAYVVYEWYLVDLNEAVELLQNTVEEPQILKLTSIQTSQECNLFSTLRTLILLVRYDNRCKKIHYLTAEMLPIHYCLLGLFSFHLQYSKLFRFHNKS